MLPHPSTIAFSAAISATEKALRWDMALHLLQQMCQLRLMSVVSFNAAISACEKCGEWRHAMLLLQDLDSLTLEADVISFSSAISAASKEQWAIALNLLQRLRRSQVRPNVIIYNAALCACTTASQHDAALQLFKTLSSDVVAPDVVTYCSIASVVGIDRCCLLDIMDTVQRLSCKELCDFAKRLADVRHPMGQPLMFSFWRNLENKLLLFSINFILKN
eukprot:symbB.v1.2.013695.t1/scaffold974.1/size359025/2